MNFFEQQELARKQSRRMVWLFMLAAFAVIVAIDVVLVLILAATSLKSQPEAMFSFSATLANHPGALALTSVLTGMVIGISSLGKMASLRSGGKAVAASMGATQVSTGSTNLHHRRLRNIVEEMAIASGVPVPEVYVLEQEPGINAFAAGFSPADAAVVVTQGALEKLTRDELQGVIAHEFSHILNGDMRLNIRLMGVLFGILVVGLIGRKILEGMRHTRDSKGLGPILLAALAIMILGYVGLFFGRMIKASISRSREYLADASAVQFTRQTDGLAGALKKVGGLQQGSKLAATDTEDVSHMLFSDGIGFSGLFATHPPLLERIQRLDKTFDPRQFADIHKHWSNKVDVLALDATTPSHSALGLTAATPMLRGAVAPGLPGAHAQVRVEAKAVAGQVGNPAADDYRAADQLHTHLPDSLKQIARRPEQAETLLLALLIDPEHRQPQFRAIAAAHGQAVVEAVRALLPELAILHPMMRLPLANLAFPSLRRRPRPELDAFVALIDQLAKADGTVSPYEFCLAALLRAQVIDFLDPARARAMGRLKLHDGQQEALCLLALVAKFGHDRAADAERAFQVAASTVYQGEAHRYAPPANWHAPLAAALAKLDRLDATGKQILIEALVRGISQDGLLSVPEAELLRVVCAALHCPLPPILSF
ncbi:peptidase M48 Ste24p [Ahniella affigens]|uniref:Peptidase M48 Ste24p n=1 Tax=Ahniella affigens TaxID=2021234 RepID=A0A2P1PVZ5_9GAMM|nr:M48 family metallopeptidase [Ahniella affigens]AVP99013.1 peptidase M48 Ste24p [Ahniella affigens]